MKLILYAKDVYGKTRYYPINDIAKIICAIAKKKTFSLEQIKICDSAGWDINIQYPQIEL